MNKLKLLALDHEDLEVISAHMQDAVLCVADMTYLPAEKRFIVITSRFNWLKANENGASAMSKDKKALERRRAALHFDRVMGAQVQNLNLSSKDRALELLAITYEMDNDPEGFIMLTFAGGGAVRLHVECIEAELKDLEAVWQAQSLPQHDHDDDQPGL